MEQFHKILAFDDILAKAGEKMKTLESNSHEQRVRGGDLIKAEGQAYIENDSSQLIRSLIARGAYHQARQILKNDNDIERKFEIARIQCYEGDFAKALTNLDIILDAEDVHLLTKMTAHQMRSLCYYELNELDKAISEVERVQALESIYPKSEAALFSYCIYIRSLELKGANVLAKLEVKKLFSKIISNSYSVSFYFQLIMYLRTKVFLAQNNNKKFAALCIAGYWLAEKLHSPIHQGLFILDLSRLQNNQLGFLARNELRYYAQKFKYIEKQIQKDRKYLVIEDEINDDFLLENKPYAILFLDESVLFHFQDKNFKPIKLSELHLKILRFIGHNKVSAENLYKNVWGANEYHSLENNAAIRTALKRLRKVSNLDVNYKQDFISIPKVVII